MPGQAHLIRGCMCAGSSFLASLFSEWPFALGSLSYLTGARLYKRAALEGYALQRRTQGRLGPVLEWARVEVLGETRHTVRPSAPLWPQQSSTGLSVIRAL